MWQLTYYYYYFVCRVQNACFFQSFFFFSLWKTSIKTWNQNEIHPIKWLKMWFEENEREIDLRHNLFFYFWCFRSPFFNIIIAYQDNQNCAGWFNLYYYYYYSIRLTKMLVVFILLKIFDIFLFISHSYNGWMILFSFGSLFNWNWFGLEFILEEKSFAI